MAIIPEYGRQVSPAGPAGSPPAPLYDIGNKAWGEVVGDLADQFGKQADRLRRAEEASKVIGGTANFTVGMTGILTESLKQQDPQKAEQFFRQESENLRRSQLDVKGLTREAQSELSDSITREYTQHHVRFMQIQENRRLRDLADQIDLGYETAKTTNNPVLLRQVVEKGRENGILGEAKAGEMLAEFPVDAQLARAYIDVNVDPELVLSETEKILSDETITEKQRGRAYQLRSLANATKANQKQKAVELWDGIVNDALSKAQTMSPAEFRMQLQQTPSLTEQQRTALLEVYLKGVKLWQDEGKNPFAVTQNEASLVQAYIGIEDGTITSLEEMNEFYMEGGKPNWSTDDMLRVKSAFYASQGLRAGDAALYANPATQEAIAKLRPVFFDENGTFKDPTPEGHMAYLRARARTMEAIRANPDNVVQRDVAVEEAQKPGKQAAAKRWLRNMADAIFNQTPPMEFSYFGRTPNYPVGQEIAVRGKKYKVTGFDADGEPLVDEVF